MSSDALSASDGTQPPDASVDSFDAGPPPEPPLPGLDLPRLPDLPPLPELSSLTDASYEPAEDVGYEPADDEVPTPPQWPAVSAADVPPSYSAPTAATPAAATPAAAMPEPAPARPAGYPMPAQPPTRPARPPVRDVEPSLLGLTRRSRTRVGQLAFKWVFAVIFGVILLQMIISLLTAR
ncbi:MAG: hypothetical protein ACR2GE_08905 [Pseudonocardia sp.]